MERMNSILCYNSSKVPYIYITYIAKRTRTLQKGCWIESQLTAGGTNYRYSQKSRRYACSLKWTVYKTSVNSATKPFSPSTNRSCELYLLARYEQIWRPTTVATVPHYYRTGSFLPWMVKTETTVQKDYHLLSISYIGDNACKRHYVSTSKRLFGSHGTNMLGASAQAVLQWNPNAGETNAIENYVELYISILAGNDRHWKFPAWRITKQLCMLY